MEFRGLGKKSTEMLWKKFKNTIANYLPLTGGTMKGRLNVPYGTHVHYNYGVQGSDGYVHLATITINMGYMNAPIEMTIARRGDNQPTKIVIQFFNDNTKDPKLQTFSVLGVATDIWICKSATSTWEIYVAKKEAYDFVNVIEYHKPEYLNYVSVTWQTDQVSALPDGAIQATVREFLGVASESKKSNEIIDYNNTNATVKIGYSGSSLDSSNLAYIAGYTSNREIKDASKDAVKAYLGISDYATHTHGEATLTWGGRSLSGDVGPVGASLSAEHSANRLAFINGDALTVEYSKDGGVTWTDYGYGADLKSRLCTLEYAIPVGRADASEKYTELSRTRITISAFSYMYTNPKKLLVNMSVSGNAELLIETKKGVENAEWETYGTIPVAGWSGWNDIDLQLSTLGAVNPNQKNNIWYLRLTFSMKSVYESSPNTASIKGIRLFGINDWASASKLNGKGPMSSTGHLYSYDMDANAVFPARVEAKTLSENGVDISNKYETKGRLTFDPTHVNEIRFEKPKFENARSVWFGWAWADGSKERLITRYLFGDGNGSLSDLEALTFHGNLDGKVNGHTVNADVPEGAKFTDTTYGDATQISHGLMTAADKNKLDDVEDGAQVNQNAYTFVHADHGSNGSDGAITGSDTLSFLSGDNVKVEVVPDPGGSASENSLKISAKDTTYDEASKTASGLMSPGDKRKLDDLPTGEQLSTKMGGMLNDIRHIKEDYTKGSDIEQLKAELKSYIDQNSAGGVSINAIYPVGSVYLTMDINFNPNESFGGTWEITSEGKALFGADITGQDPDFETPGLTGGEKTHTLTTDELPPHDHSATTTVDSKSLTGKVWNFAGQGASNGPGNSTSGVFSKGGDTNCFYPSATKTATGISDGFTLNATHNHAATTTVNSTGSGKAHNNLPPYQTIVVWQRTA